MTVSYDLADPTTGGASAIIAPRNTAISEPLGVTFTTAAGTSNEIPVEAFSWGGTGGTPSPSLQDFRLVLDPDSAEPDLWGALASGATFSQVVLHGRRSTFEYLTYTLSNVKVSSFQTDSPEAVRDTITLSFTKIAEKFTPRNEDGTPGMPVTVSYVVIDPPWALPFVLLTTTMEPSGDTATPSGAEPVIGTVVTPRDSGALNRRFDCR